jgi:1-deoxy-D-xylulose-5-phosphate synthase
MTNLLPHIDQPSDLRALSRAQLPGLAAELRQYVLESVARTGGHLSSNLGTVELTIALHYVFNTPEDRIVWDVGHQTYPHKILTGRRDRMHSLRQFGGISGFPKRDESEYDTFGTAHSSTSISAALGMAMAAHQKGEHRHAIAVIGDGAMTAGMAFEALNNAGVQDVPLLVVLNDNDMSISPPVGALNRYLAQLMSGQFYAAAKQVGKQVLKNAPPLFELAKRLEEHAKGMVVPATLFEKFGFNYVGPIDGHDLDSLIPTLENITPPQGPSVSARGDQKRPRLQAGRGRPRGLPRPRQVRPRRGSGQACRGTQNHVHAGVWQLAVRHGCARCASGGHHPRHARRLGHGRVSPPVP